MGRSPGLPIDSIGNTSGTSNWQGFVGDGAVYCSNPVELMNYDIGFHDFIGIGSHASLPGIGSNSSLRGNGGLNQLDEMYSQFHPDVPQNFMANKCAGTTNNGVRFTNLSSQGNRSSDNLLQSLMRLPPMAICNGIENGSLFANGYVTPHLYAQESNYRMEPNFACSTPLDPNYYVDSTHRHSSSNNSSLSETLQDGFPVPYQPRYMYVDPPSNIRSSCLLAPPTPQPANRSYPYSQTINLSRDPNEVVLDELVASSASYFSQFAPATPRPANIADNYQLLPAQNLSLDQVQNQDNDVRKDILVAPTQNESLDHDCQEIIQNVQETSSAAISASVKERNGLENQENEIINLNKTPSVKTPRRRKHRPKVIVENKRPRTRKPAEAKPKEKASADGIPVPKRKYVRKNKSNAINDGNKTNDSTSEPVSNSCRRSLNFDRQDIIDTANLVEQQETQYETQEHVSYNVIAQEAGTISSQRNGDWNGHVQGNREEGTTTSLYPRMHEIQKDVFQHSNRHLRGAHLVTTEQHIKKSQMSTSDEAKRAANLYRTTLNSYDLPARQPLFLGEDQTRIQEITALEKLERTRQMIVQKQQQRVSECIQSRGCKRYYGLTQEHENSIHSANLISSQVNILQDLQERVIDQCYSGTPKRNKTDYPCHTSSSIQYSARLAEKSSGQVLIGRPENHLIEVNSELFNSPSKLNADPAYPCNKQTVSSKASLRQEQPAEKDRASALAHVINSLSAQAYPNMQNQMLAIEGFTRSQSLVTVPAKRVKHAIESVKKQNPAENNTGSRVKQKHQQMVSVDDIIDQLKCLNLNSANDEQKALVLYKSDGTIIPYEGFDPLKRRKPRPKVDLDPETNRLWKLLMGKELTDDEKQTDEQKTKWWEEQRSVFRGRADSFIARMHLVQGDRRFSPWKGSVVDSVIGVFLTQNVTDHLSSSAFMSLAARFPLHSLRTVASGNHKPEVLVEEPEICIIQTNEEIQKLASVDHIQQSVTEKYWRLEEIIPSQDSAEYPIVHMNGAVPSLITSDSTEDSQINGFQTTGGYKTSFITEETENFIRFPDITSQEIRSSYYKTAIDRHVQLQNADSNKKTKLDGLNSNGMRTVSHSFDLNSPLLQDSTISSTNVQFPTVGGLGMREIDGSYMLGNHNHMYFHQRAASEDMVVPSKSDKQPLHRQSKMVEDASTYNLSGPISSPGKSISTAEKGVIVQNNVESNLKKQDCSSMEATNRTKTNVSKVKDGKAKGEHTTFDWDCLRRQVKSNRNSRERSQDTMDSMDYETIRNADVHEISEAIRERGMNNMLADRMKDFLNRVVRDHGSIDLEWLREAPPDKVKDYLLSIRGLGLKSVECIRLLTLHQHAFPVDTNVGRIAVRLGWVPLQPLPESLQLHLLEMYPVLETIQKYLWPRLCNLDQRTLYELHYQLITFGKVFCTKSKPNCNACPMRGECRHFASAFASSRLALPGPEEKSIVPSDIPFEASKSPTIVVSPMPLHTLQDVPLGEAALTHKACEPIVEEPTTPEQDIAEFSETDIEDTLYEESDEIPTIRLDVEEFTQNLQNFMQENLELQEFDMSKALVALNPRAASIPTPKLKNVNRLRTEHQVYQLPDSHPLLKELDNREPDDPSPYLLAIWTPGETAYSIQPPEGTCSFQESGGLCNESTCFSCNSIRESNSQTVRGTILIPCRTAMRGSFPLNGTYFQVNEVFADHESSLKPIDVPRAWIWNLPRRTVYFGTSVTTIFKGMSTEDIQYCFWRGFVCVRGFDHKTRIPRPLMARLHFPASKLVRGKKEEKNTK